MSVFLSMLLAKSHSANHSYEPIEIGNIFRYVFLEGDVKSYRDLAFHV
jgi:hypothetical protein